LGFSDKTKTFVLAFSQRQVFECVAEMAGLEFSESESKTEK
jgi:hypothetical protein